MKSSFGSFRVCGNISRGEGLERDGLNVTTLYEVRVRHLYTLDKDTMDLVTCVRRGIYIP